MIIKSLEKLAEHMKTISGGRILDLATGRGEFIQFLQQALKDYESINGIDNSEKSIEFAQKSNKDDKVTYQVGDAYNLSFEDESFDIVTLSNSLHHFEEPEKILDEMKRILKPSGLIIVSEMHCDEDQEETQKTHVLMHHWWGEIDTRLGIVHNKTYTRGELIDLVEKLQCNDLTIFEYAYPIENPKDPDFISRYKGVIDPYVDRIKCHDDYESLKQEGEELSKRLDDVGFAPASVLFFIGTK